ncbi:MAG: hypothetical protein RR792_07100 [Thermomonas sp.]
MNMPIKSRIAIALVVTLAALGACKRDDAAPAVAKPTNGDYLVQDWVLPAQAGSMAPDLRVAPDGRVLISWLNRQQGRRNVLQFSSYTEAGGWQSLPRTIAVGQSLVANWADTPHMLATADGALWVQWLQANAASPSAYDVALARSRDGGMTWTQITRVNDDQTASEHGFAALWPRGANAVGIAWLDGREQQGAHATDAKDVAHHGGAMQLRANGFDMDLARGADAVVDARACDCCQTDAASTDRGTLLAWRDRSDDEVRDIVVSRLQDDGAWTKPVSVHADGWKVEACPVNGPAIAASGNAAVVAWYSEAGGTPTVRIARSTNAGDAFAAPVIVDSDAAVRGQVDVAMDAQQAWVAWLREDAKGQALMLARYTPDLSKRLQLIEVARLGARGHASGTPRLAVDAGGAWLAWTDVVDGVADLQGARITR